MSSSPEKESVSSRPPIWIEWMCVIETGTLGAEAPGTKEFRVC